MQLVFVLALFHYPASCWEIELLKFLFQILRNNRSYKNSLNVCVIIFAFRRTNKRRKEWHFFPSELKHGSPAKPDPSDTPMIETKQSSTGGGSTTAMDEPLIIKVEEKPSHGHPERKRRASDDSIDVSNRDFYYLLAWKLYWLRPIQTEWQRQRQRWRFGRSTLLFTCFIHTKHQWQRQRH